MQRLKTSRETVTRETQEIEVIYVGPEVDEDKPGGVFVTTDGIGRYWYDSVEEAQEQHGDDLPICHLDVTPDD